MEAAGPVGSPKQELDTPALVVDLDALDRNIDLIAGTCRANGKAWRPHIKGLKVPAIAHKAIAAGAIGVTCAKLGEAEAMAAAGIKDILIANQVVGPQKVARLAGLCRQACVTVAVDSEVQANALDAAARKAGARIGVVIEVDIGNRRAGVDPGPPAAALAGQIAHLPNIEFRGVMGWEGHACPIPDPTVKQAAIAAAVGSLVASAEACRAAGMPVEIVSCGGTGTYRITALQPGVTELQAGGGIFCDIRYRQKFGVAHEYALTVMTTITSRPNPWRIVCDAGKKSMSSDAAMPEPMSVGPVKSVALSAEHTVIELQEANTQLRIGDKLEFIVGYSDTTTHLHDVLFGTRGGLVEVAWPILGRGVSR